MTTRAVEIGDPSGVAEARRVALAVARALGFDEEDAGRVALVATELGTNLSKHATTGEMLVSAIEDAAGAAAVEFIALDRGAGIANLGSAMRDGFSTAGSPGTGLGAIRRASHAFDVFSQPGLGTAVLARVRKGTPPADPAAPAPTSAVVDIPQKGEEVSGDAWSLMPTATGFAAMVADGLGHGPGAAQASHAAIAVFAQSAWASPGDALALMHKALVPTRGAAVAVVVLDAATRTASFAGIGNVMAAVVGNGGTKQMVSMHGTVGHSAKRVQSFSYPFEAGGVLVMCSDGVLTNWSLARYPGLLARDPALIAGILYRDFKRGRDDLTVLVVRT